MAYKFTLRDEEDELSAPVLADPEWSLAQTAPIETAPPVVPPVRASQDMWQPTSTRDPALNEQWSLAEKNMLARAQYNPNEYGLSEGLRDNAGMAIAGVLDVALNKGRGLGSIASEATKINQQGEAMRRQDAAQAANFALGARRMKSADLADQLAVKRLQNQDRTLSQQDQRIELALKGEGRRGQEFGRKYDPNNAQVSALKDQIVEASGGRIQRENLDGLDADGLKAMGHAYNLQYDSANTNQKAHDEAVIGGARSAATANAANASEARWAPVIGAQRGVGEARAEEITRPGAVKTAAETRAATETAVNAVNQPKEEAKATREFAEKNSGKLKMLSTLDEMLSGVPEKGAAPGTGYAERLKSSVGLGSFNSQEAQDADAALSDIIIKASAEDFGANSTARQELGNTKRILGDPLASPEQRTRALRRFRDSVEADLAGASAANPKAAAAVQEARAGARGTNGFGGGTKMRSPNGNVGVVPPDKVQAALAAGWTAEN